MTSIPTITALGSALRSAFDLAKIANNVDLKVQLNAVLDLVEQLREELAERDGRIAKAEKEIADLREALRFKGTLERRGDAYFEKLPDGSLVPDRICRGCWDSEHRVMHLTKIPGSQSSECPKCRHRIANIHAPIG